ncbi:MAG: MMPL family transporter [Thermoguttaceae bacterium]|jgi:predicted RND superfamily exporter protein|nr:MMPL family transporter [Thermoguttaceae bacterium]
MDSPRRSLLETLYGWLIRGRHALLAGSLVLIVLAWFPASRLAFDQSIESLYAPSDPHLLAYLDSRRLFGGDEFVIVAWPEPQLFREDTGGLTSDSANRIRAFARQLSEVPGVRGASTQTLADALRFPYRRDRVREMAEGTLLGLDGTTTSVVLRLLPADEAPVPRGRTIGDLRELAAAHDPPAYVVGEPVQIFDMFRYVEQDGRTLFRISLALLALVIAILFRRVRWVLLAMLVVLAAIVWTQALLVMSGMQLSLVSSMLNSLVTVIGIATVMHVTVHFRDLRRTSSRTDAMHRTLTDLGPAVFWTCATTGAGFAALLVSDLSPVRSFAVMMALGTLLVLLAMAAAMPGGILIGRLGADPGRAPLEAPVVRALGRLVDRLERRPLPAALAAAALVAFAAAGFLRLEVETDFSRNFRRSSPIVEALWYVEGELGGAANWEVNFPAPPELTDDYLQRVSSLAERLREELGQPPGSAPRPGRLTKVLSLTDGLDLVPRQMLFHTTTLAERLAILAQIQPEAVSTFYNAEAGRMRIMLRSLEQQPAEAKQRLIAGVERLAAEEFSGPRVTGLFVLLTFLIESLLSDQVQSFVLAAGGIGAMMAVAFRSVRIGLALLVPNVVPIVLVIGTMGWIGLPINIATAMIASVSMGLTIDCSIHYLFGYRRARAAGLSRFDALRATHENVGLALVFANLALIIGFSVLTLSHFIPLIHFGVLVSVAMFGGLAGNLVLLPLLLRWLESGRAGG